MKRLIHISTIIILTIGYISCDRIKNKSEQVAEQAKKKVKGEVRQQAKKVINKVYPPFDHDKPDTENNKKRFKDFLKVDISEDVKKIYCFDDAIGINASYMFAFECNEGTSNAIIKTHNLKLDSSNIDNGFAMQKDFEWWDKERIKDIEKFVWKGDNQFYKFYWYDKENGKAYFFAFDL